MAITLKKEKSNREGVPHSWRNEKLILNSGEETSSEEITWVTYMYKVGDVKMWITLILAHHRNQILYKTL
jgi:hypothetical protein